MTEIQELELIKGWTAEKITATGAETKTVKSSAGKVARVLVDTSDITVILKDNTTAKWIPMDKSGVNSSDNDFSSSPIQCNTSIKLTFSGAGDAWIIYK